MMFISLLHDMMFVAHYALCGSSISMFLSYLCVLIQSIISRGFWPGPGVHRLLARFAMPKSPYGASAVGQVHRRPPNDNCEKHFNMWLDQGVDIGAWPDDVPQSAIMMVDQSRPPLRTSSFLKKSTWTKNQIERSWVFCGLGVGGVVVGFGWRYAAMTR